MGHGWTMGPAAGYVVVWKNDQTWKGIKTHMGYNQEAYDAECAAPRPRAGICL
jgi:hypothetical protein